MEISTISFITLVVSDYGFVSEVSAWKYYVYQCVGSVLLFLPLVLSQSGVLSPVLLYSGLVGVSLNLGLFPLQGWVPHVIENIELTTLFVLGSVQNVAPLVAMFHLQVESVTLWPALVVTALWAGFSSIGRYSVNQILALSSILISAWLGFSLLSYSLAVGFFCVYSYHLLILLLGMSDFPFHGNVSTLFLPSSGDKAVKSLAFGAFIGLPPFGIFLIKMEVGSVLVETGTTLPVLAILLCSGLILFAYVKITFPMVMQKGWISFNPASVVLILSLFFPIALF